MVTLRLESCGFNLFSYHHRTLFLGVLFVASAAKQGEEQEAK